jgi:outer membrane protein TolC
MSTVTELLGRHWIQTEILKTARERFERSLITESEFKQAEARYQKAGAEFEREYRTAREGESA